MTSESMPFSAIAYLLNSISHIHCKYVYFFNITSIFLAFHLTTKRLKTL